MSTMNDWIKEANERAKQYADAIRQNSQSSIDQLTQSKNNALAQLQEQQNNAMYNLNTNKSAINSTTEENARQLDIARMLALKSNQQSLNRAGLGTQGIVGSQVNSINNNYNTNLASVLNERLSSLNDLEKSKNDTLTQYNTNKLNLETEYGNNLSNLQQTINDKALNQYNTIYQDYLAQKQQEYEKQQDELARQEAIRQYNEQFEYQKQQDAKQLALAYAQLYNKNNNIELTDEASTSKENVTDNRTDSEKRYAYLSGIIQKCKTNPGYMDESTISQGILNSLNTGTLTEKQAEELYSAMESVFKTNNSNNNVGLSTPYVTSKVNPTLPINYNLNAFTNSKLPMNYNFPTTTKIK